MPRKNPRLLTHARAHFGFGRSHYKTIAKDPRFHPHLPANASAAYIRTYMLNRYQKHLRIVTLSRNIKKIVKSPVFYETGNFNNVWKCNKAWTVENCKDKGPVSRVGDLFVDQYRLPARQLLKKALKESQRNGHSLKVFPIMNIVTGKTHVAATMKEKVNILRQGYARPSPRPFSVLSGRPQFLSDSFSPRPFSVLSDRPQFLSDSFFDPKYEEHREEQVWVNVVGLNGNAIHSDRDIDDYVRCLLKAMQDHVDSLPNGEGSERYFVRGNWLELQLSHFQAISGGSFVPLPDFIKAKKCIINIQNKDDRCLEYSLVCALHYQETDGKHLDRPAKWKQWMGTLDFGNLIFPIQIHKGKAISLIEKRNGLCINVFCFIDEDLKMDAKNYRSNLLCAYKSPVRGVPPINVLYYKSHFVWIKDWSAFTNCNGEKHKVCPTCFSSFKLQENFDKHCLTCDPTNPTNTKMPPVGSTESFTAFEKTYRHPVCIYADCEAFNKTEETVGMKDSVYAQVGASFRLRVVLSPGLSISLPLTHTYVYDGSSTTFSQAFVDTIKTYANCIQDEIFSKNVDMKPLTDEQEEKHERATHCPCCSSLFGESKTSKDGSVYVVEKIRDHDHLTGEYRNALCRECNMYLGKKEFMNRNVPVFFHNLKGYDAHLIMNAFSTTDMIKNDLYVLPDNSEKFKAMTWSPLPLNMTVEEFDNLQREKRAKETTKKRKKEISKMLSRPRIRFLDTAQLLEPGSLDSLLKNLPIEDKKFLKSIATRLDGTLDEDLFSLVEKKGFFPYEWFSDASCLERTSLPPRNEWRSRLTRSFMSKEDYAHAQKVWDAFGMKTFKDYHDLYLRIDVDGLADKFESFRTLCLTHFGLDPTHYVSSPGLFKDAMLKKTGVKLDLITDIDMYNLFETNIRGGMSFVGLRHCVANNKYMGDKYDPSIPSKFNLYNDCTALYNWAMKNRLPLRAYTWLSDRPLEEWLRLVTTPASLPASELKTTLQDSETTGFALEVDMHVPDELHDYFSNFPLAPTPMKVDKHMLSKVTMEDCTRKKYVPTRKLVGSLLPLKNYLVHHSTLALYVSLGMVVTKVHRAVGFVEKEWMEPFCSFCEEMRRNATTDAEKDFWKLAVNANFGKTMENVRKRCNPLKFVTEEDGFMKLTRQPTYTGKCFKYSDSLFGVEMKKGTVVLDKPISIGFAVLDISKIRMFDFYYNTILPFYGVENVSIGFSDTDSLYFHIKTEDLYADLANASLCDNFDLSNYPKEHVIWKKLRDNYEDTECEEEKALLLKAIQKGNKKVPGKFKDEDEGNIALEGVFLAPKMNAKKTLVEGTKKINFYDGEGEEEVRSIPSSLSLTVKGVKKAVMHTIGDVDDFKAVLYRERELPRVRVPAIVSKQHKIGVIDRYKVAITNFDTKRYYLDRINSLPFGHYSIRE